MLAASPSLQSTSNTVLLVDPRLSTTLSCANASNIDVLRALQIVPPPVPLEERPEEELNVAELQELVKRFKVRLMSIFI